MISLKPGRQKHVRPSDARMDLFAGGGSGGGLDTGRPAALMKTSRKTAKALEVWRFQRDRIYPDIITGMTKDKKRWVFITAKSDRKAHAAWVKRFGRRQTIYAVAQVGMSVRRPTVHILREVDEW